MGGGSGCETTASTVLSPLLTSLLSHCSHGGHFFTPETFVNDGLSGHRRRRRPLSRSSLTKVSAVKRSAMRSDGSHSTLHHNSSGLGACWRTYSEPGEAKAIRAWSGTLRRCAKANEYI